VAIDDPALNNVIPNFKKSPVDYFLKKYFRKAGGFYFVKKQTTNSGFITISQIYFLGIPIYRSVRTSDKD
jgi:hypothetical protein